MNGTALRCGTRWYSWYKSRVMPVSPILTLSWQLTDACAGVQVKTESSKPIQQR